jgi:hypothetical protein
MCSSGDSKPTDSSVPVGSLCWVLDEKKEYIYDGTSWTAKS